VISDLVEIGFSQLPGVLWRKPASSPTKFMGAGMLGLNAYTTLEHEHILVFRKGGNRKAASGDEKRRRRESAYFWEERNRWFTDVWTDLRGVRQTITSGHEDLRKRSAAFPLELPLRLIHMYSIYGDTILDPFWGTGTTSLAAALLGRHSVGYEIDQHFWPLFADRMEKAAKTSRRQNTRRLEKHTRFAQQRQQQDKPPKYENETYGFGVVTRQERQIKLYDVDAVEQSGDCAYRCMYEPHHAHQPSMFAGASDGQSAE
jgi:DNA modification methylase